MAISATQLLAMRIIWHKVRVGEWETIVDGEKYGLAMNDFPEEPLYTVHHEGGSFDVEEKPAQWDIDFTT